MSGICGIVRLDGGDVARGDVMRQMAALAHLGADRADVVCEGRIGMGRRLMAVTREDALDRQPVRGPGFLLVADCRIDNREVLAEMLGLAPDALAKMADAALIGAAWARWGAECVEHLLGDFAFAVWEEAARRLTLARDHMGQRHLFYHRGEGFFAFATENRGLFALPEVPRRLDEDAAVLRLARIEHRDARAPGETFHVGINALPGGRMLVLDGASGCEVRQYWDPHAAPEHLGRDEAYYRTAYAAVLGEAVACRVRRAMAPAALMLSGGFDSGSIAALGSPVAAAGLVALSSVMAEGYAGPIRHAREYVEYLRRHLPHLTVRYLTAETIDLIDGMEADFATHNDPHSPNRAINSALLREARAAGARVMMDGHGGDYTLNPRGIGFIARLIRAGRLVRSLREFRMGRRHLGLSRWAMFKREVLWELAPQWLKQIRQREWMGLSNAVSTMPLAADVLSRYRPGAAREDDNFVGAKAAHLRVLRKIQGGQAMGTSIHAAHHGLEFTQPFHDKRVVELGMAIPEDIQVQNGQVRWLAKTALAGVLPPEFLNRRPANDPLDPDFAAMMERARPRVLAELARMEAGGKLSDLFDFAEIRRRLTREMREGNAWDQMPVGQGMSAFITARYVQWFRGDNC